MEIRRVLLAAACLAAIGLPSSAGVALAGSSTRTTLESSGVRSFWTPKKMDRAVPLDAPRDMLGAEALATQARVPPFVSEPVPDPFAQPYPAVGKVFFRIDGGLYVCSAAITDAPSRSLVWTAGHCVRDPGRRGEFATKWIFVPGYDQGSQPYGSWPAKLLGVTRAWARRNQHFDFGAAVIRPQGGVGVEDAVGSALPLGTNSAYEQSWEAVGFPEASIWGQQMWRCDSGLYRRDVFPGSGPDPVGIGCDMTGGSSGGPWINEAGELAAVTSYSYRDDPDALYGTYLGSAAAKLYSQLRNRR
jgi:hypothetical protein